MLSCVAKLQQFPGGLVEEGGWMQGKWGGLAIALWWCVEER